MRLPSSTFVNCLLATALFLAACRPASADTVVDFEDLTLAAESFYNGSDAAGGFISQGAFFNNSYDPQFAFWLGWSYSNQTDVTTSGFLNQYSAYNLPNGGGDGSANYGVAFNSQLGDAYVRLPDGTMPASTRAAFAPTIPSAKRCRCVTAICSPRNSVGPTAATLIFLSLPSTDWTATVTSLVR